MKFSQLFSRILGLSLLASGLLPLQAGAANSEPAPAPQTDAHKSSQELLKVLSPEAQRKLEEDMKAYTQRLEADKQVSMQTRIAQAIPEALDWSPANQAKIEAFFKATDLKGKVAVFDADDTLWRHDVGEGFLKYLQERDKLVMVPPGFDAFARYEALCAQNKWMGYPYAAQVMAGMKESDVRALAKDFFENHFKQNVYPAQKALIKRLQQAGVEVWIVSASNQWIVEAGAPALGVPLDHVIGVRLDVVKGVVTANIVPPMTFRQGKVDAINTYIKAQPVLVSGDSITDYEMLKIASRLQLVINPKDKNAPAENIFMLATEHGWPIQRW